MSKCGKPCCEGRKLMLCSSCMVEGYCGPECQKADWKIHKLMCGSMKSGKKLLSFSEIKKIIEKLLDYVHISKKTNGNKKILEYCLSFVEHQFGEKIIGRTYCERFNERIDYTEIDFSYLIRIYFELFEEYCHSEIEYKLEKNEPKDNILIASVQKAIYYSEKIIYLLEYWEKQIRLPEIQQVGFIEIKTTLRFSNDMTNIMYSNFTKANVNLGICHLKIGNYNKARCYTDNAICYAKQIIKREVRIICLHAALDLKGNILSLLFKYDEALVIYEKAYNLLVQEYYPDHCRVLEAARSLITILIIKKEYYDAERYACITYECLKQSDKASKKELYLIIILLAEANYGLLTTNKKKDGIDEVEMLLRKAISLCDEVNGPNSIIIIDIYDLLVKVLYFKETENVNYDNEIKDLIEKELAIVINKENDNSPRALATKEKLVICYIRMSFKLEPGDPMIKEYVRLGNLLS